MPLLITDANTNVTGEELVTRGGKYEIKCWADAWDGAQVEIQVFTKSPTTTAWIPLFDTVSGTIKLFTTNEQAIIDMVATGNRIRPVLSGAGGSTSNVNCEIRRVS